MQHGPVVVVVVGLAAGSVENKVTSHISSRARRRVGRGLSQRAFLTTRGIHEQWKYEWHRGMMGRIGIIRTSCFTVSFSG